jgi:hypothetical protein
VLVLLSVPAATADRAEVTLSIWAVQAVREGHNTIEMDPALVPVRDELRGLPYDTFRSLLITEKGCPRDADASLRLTDRYTLVTKFIEEMNDGRLRIELCILMPPPPEYSSQEPVVVLTTVLKLSPGKQVKLGGMKLEVGDLIVVLAAR